jgi:hypothetical protein
MIAMALLPASSDRRRADDGARRHDQARSALLDDRTRV